MAEEKIAIAKMITNTDVDGSANLDRFKIYDRQEAIKRMADAIWETGGSEMQQAEAALNTLLGDDK